jgi:hypothetical protein
MIKYLILSDHFLENDLGLLYVPNQVVKTNALTNVISTIVNPVEPTENTWTKLNFIPSKITANRKIFLSENVIPGL